MATRIWAVRTRCVRNLGSGVGVGGEPGEPGENCVPQGNVLIIQEDDEEEPNDREGGGMITFEFQPNVEVFEIGLMDIEGNDSSITVSHLNPSGRERVREVEISGLGDNSVQTVPINRPDVFQLKVNLAGSGAITSLTLCIKDDESVPTQSPSALATANPTNVPTGSPIDSPIAASSSVRSKLSPRLMFQAMPHHRPLLIFSMVRSRAWCETMKERLLLVL